MAITLILRGGGRHPPQAALLSGKPFHTHVSTGCIGGAADLGLRTRFAKYTVEMMATERIEWPWNGDCRSILVDLWVKACLSYAGPS